MSLTSEVKLASGHTYEKLSGEDEENLKKDFPNYTSGAIRLQPGGWFFPPEFLKYADKVYNFEFRPTDVLVMTWPKMGTTWTQEILWTMLNNRKLDNPEASVAINTRCPFLEIDMLLESIPNNEKMLEEFSKVCPGKDPADGVILQMADVIPNPRVLKTHLPLTFFRSNLLDTCKVVYVARNPKDGVLSYEHHHRLLDLMKYVGTTERFVQYFVDDQLMWSPYWEHIREGWMAREHPNLYFSFYEDMKADIEGSIREFDKLLGTNLTDQEIKIIIEHTSFENMKKDDTMSVQFKDVMDSEVIKKDGGFFRKGEAGSWKKKLTPSQNAIIDDWTKKNTLGLGIEFKYQ